MTRVGLWLRQQWGGVVVLLICVVISGILLRVGQDAPSGATYAARVGTPERLSSAIRIVVTNVRVAGRVQNGLSVVGVTSEVFLVVDYTVMVDNIPYGSVHESLHSGDRTYSSLTEAIGVPETGFQRRRHLTYEMPMADLVGSKVRLYVARDLRQYERIVVVDLGLTEAKVAELTKDRYQTINVTDGEPEAQR